MMNRKDLKIFQNLQYRILENSTFGITYNEEIPREVLRAKYMKILIDKYNGKEITF